MLFLGAFRLEDVEQNRFLQILRQARDGSGSTARPARAGRRGLTQAESRELALALLGRDDPVARAQAHLIARESAGNPLFIERAGQASSRPARSRRAGMRAARSTWRPCSGPASRPCPLDAQRLLEVVSVSGRPIDQSLAFRAAELGTGGRVALGSLRSARLVRGTGPAEREQVETYHDRIRETVLAHLPAESLALVPRAARPTAGERSPRSTRRSWPTTCEAPGKAREPREFYTQAADKAAHALAFDQAARLYRLALELHTGSAAVHRGIARRAGRCAGQQRPGRRGRLASTCRRPSGPPRRRPWS